MVVWLLDDCFLADQCAERVFLSNDWKSSVSLPWRSKEFCLHQDIESSVGPDKHFPRLLSCKQVHKARRPNFVCLLTDVAFVSFFFLPMMQ
jgi:hypothetical protein